MSRVQQIRNDVRAAVAALPAVTGRSITPVATWVPPSRDRSEVDATEIWVAVSQRAVKLIQRGGASETYQVNIAIYDPLETATEDTQAEANQVLAEAIIDALLTTRLGSGSRGICYRASQDVLQNVGHWREKRLWTSFLTLEYRNL